MYMTLLLKHTPSHSLTLTLSLSLSLSLFLSLSPPVPISPGEYHFSIEMSDVTAAGCVELWLSTDQDPLNMHKVLVLDYDDMVSLCYMLDYANQDLTILVPIIIDMAMTTYHLQFPR